MTVRMPQCDPVVSPIGSPVAVLNHSFPDPRLWLHLLVTTNVFVNLPVRDLKRSMDFFAGLGFTFNPKFTDENAACLVLSDSAFVMLLVRPFFATFAPKPVADGATTEVLVGISRDSREEVTEMVNRAIGLGAVIHRHPDDLGFMYSWSFQDLDGHLWEVLWMDPAHIA